jgi:hypothetical protein
LTKQNTRNSKPTASGSTTKRLALMAAVLDRLPAHRLAGHFHDTSGHALYNIKVGLARGLRVFDASVGGLGAHLLTLASDAGLMDTGLKIRTMRLPDMFQEHDSPQKQYDQAGLNAPQIVETVLKALRHNSAGVEEASVRA